MKNSVPADLAARYERDGFVIIPDLITAEECDKLKSEARNVLSNKGRPGASVHLFVALENPYFRALSEDPRVVGPLTKLMPHGVQFLNDKLVYKSADKTFPTPWHIDCFYWRNTRPKLSVWLPLDDATAANGTLTVIPGSHKKDWKMVKKGLANGEFHDEVGNADWREGDIVTCAIKRGTGIFFSDRLVHGSTPNTAGQDRYAIIGTYQAPAADEPFDLDFPARKVLVPAA
ncbi:MAG: phytanoyl-CoA dioxygenase family protein [Verrucomicrobia bacterium]|nr:phytanoyl-CoA dioxygenase family protein [Verrucomicrobiota bacterium]